MWLAKSVGRIKCGPLKRVTRRLDTGSLSTGRLETQGLVENYPRHSIFVSLYAGLTVG